MKAPVAFPDEPEPDRYVQQATAAFTAATDLDALKRARLDHAGDRSPIALMRRGIGELPPEQRTPAAISVAAAHAWIARAAADREVALGIGANQ